MSAPAGHTGTLRYCGRHFTPAELDTIRALTTSLPTRAQIAEATCQALDWRRVDGRTKAMSARVALNRMADDGLLALPAPRNTNGNGRGPRHDRQPMLPLDTIHAPLADLGPLTPRVVSTLSDSRTWNTLIATHHYLGYTPLAGAQLRYLIHAPAGVVAALGFAASAWTCAPATPTSAGTALPARPGCTWSSATPDSSSSLTSASPTSPPRSWAASPAACPPTGRPPTDTPPCSPRPSSTPNASPGPATGPRTGSTSEPPKDAANSTATINGRYPSKTSTSTHCTATTSASSPTQPDGRHEQVHRILRAPG